MTHHIRQEVELASAPERIYGILTDATQFSAMCGRAPTEIDARDGGAFSCFGGMILGRNIECVSGKRLVQAWRAKNWEEGHYSIVRFELAPHGKGTKLVLDHSSFLEGQGEHLAQGWQKNYWEPMKKL